jgi:arylsulfatase A-like enzyme
MLLAASCGAPPEVIRPVARFAVLLSGDAPLRYVSIDRRTRPVLPGRPFVDATGAGDAGAPWEVVEGDVDGRRGWRARLASAPLRIPDGAFLDFGIGVSGRRRSGAPVRFSVSACDGDACSRLFDESLLAAAQKPPVWHDRRVDLAALAGLERSIVFETARVGARESTDLPVWASPTLYAPAPGGDRGPNLLLISIDTLRADHLGTYGYGRDTDPFLREQLAAGGTVFERVISAASTTGPSHMTIFTSLDPRVHGVIPTARFGTLLPRGVVTLAEALYGAGFETGAVTEDGPLGPQRGFARGFADFEESIDSDGGTSGHAAKTFAMARAWIERHPSERFFLFVHTYQVHAPYTPPEAYADLFEDEERPQGVPPEWDPVLYDREIRLTDDLLRDFFDFLAKAGLLDDTIVVFTSDHGEAFLEHGFLGHGPDLHDEILHVPLIFHGPGIPAGRRVRVPVGLVDLMPTLLDLVGAPPVPGVMGRSFAPMLRGAPDPAAAVRPIFSSAWQTRAVFADGRAARVPQPTFSVQVGPRKLIRYTDGSRSYFAYYDLEEDPAEESDALSRSPREASELAGLLDRYEAESRARRSALLAQPDALAPEPTLEPEREQRLRELGYIE